MHTIKNDHLELVFSVNPAEYGCLDYEVVAINRKSAVTKTVSIHDSVHDSECRYEVSSDDGTVSFSTSSDMFEYINTILVSFNSTIPKLDMGMRIALKQLYAKLYRLNYVFNDTK